MSVAHLEGIINVGDTVYLSRARDPGGPKNCGRPAIVIGAAKQYQYAKKGRV
jgi:hypothetical protein